ncbi:CRISPR-associated endonuclease Cas2 [Elioraea sp.]|uniref:CRISPR-associated endonuclease Cas2 n=1 Tax=Elioraea sp. TaxID=2185103 RepID=UPI003F72FDA9
MRARRTWIVGYDITSPKRLRRVAKHLEKSASRLQFSLFVGCWSEAEFERVWTGLARLINRRHDDVRAWPVPEAAVVTTIGTALPEGIVLGEARSQGLGRILAGEAGVRSGGDSTGRRRGG